VRQAGERKRLPANSLPLSHPPSLVHNVLLSLGPTSLRAWPEQAKKQLPGSSSVPSLLLQQPCGLSLFWGLCVLSQDGRLWGGIYCSHLGLEWYWGWLSSPTHGWCLGQEGGAEVHVKGNEGSKESAGLRVEWLSDTFGSITKFTEEALGKPVGSRFWEAYENLS
jgi:hypothetical protein